MVAAAFGSEPSGGSDRVSFFHTHRTQLAVFVGFWIIFLGFYLLSGPVDQALWRSTTLETEFGARMLESEYTVAEHLSKFYILLSILISIFAYKVADDALQVRIAISFLVFGLILYLAESDMIEDDVQPAFLLIGMISTLGFLFVRRSWQALVLLLLGIGLGSVGVLKDALAHHGVVSALLPGPVVEVLMNYVKEELVESIGLGFICLAVISYVRDPISTFVRRNRRGAVSLVLAAAAIAVGNGYLAYVYGNREIRWLGLIITVIGFAGLVLTNTHLLKESERLTMVSEDYLYLFVFAAFVILPATYGRIGNAMSLLLWLPTLTLFGFHLYRRHPVRASEAYTRS